MKIILLFAMTLTFLSCNESTQTGDIEHLQIDKNLVDTALVKIDNRLANWFDAEYSSRSYTYCWVSGNDTLDFTIGITEDVSDSTLALRFFHREPILFSKAMENLNSCLPMIKQDFDLDNLISLNFEPPIFYKDLTTELSKSYESHFGRRYIKYEELNEFLMNSWLERKVDAFLNQLGKGARRYSIEKFHLLDKENYDEYILNSDLNDYPAFSIHGMGISLIIDKKK